MAGKYMQKPKNPAAVSLGRLGGMAKSPRKAAAARLNGMKGGRPKGSKQVKDILRKVLEKATK